MSAVLPGCLCGNGTRGAGPAEFDYGVDSWLKMLQAIEEAQEQVSTYLNKSEVS